MSAEDELKKQLSSGVWGRQPDQQEQTRERPLPSSLRLAGQVPEQADAAPLIIRPDRIYEAYSLRNHSGRLLIVRAADVGRCPAYHYLQDMKIDLFTNSGFVLIYPGLMNVLVKGRNLQNVWHAIMTGNCYCIREFHNDLYDKPAKEMPFIEAIRIEAPDEEQQAATTQPAD